MHQVWPCHNGAVYISAALGTQGLHSLSHTLLMAICGHYSPIVSHNNAPEYSLYSSRASGSLHNTTAATVATVDAVYCSCYWCWFSHSTPSNTSYWPTSMPAVKQGVVYLLARWVRYTHTHAKYELSNGRSSHAVSPPRVYPFHSSSIPRSYFTSLMFSSFNLSVSLPSH